MRQRATHQKVKQVILLSGLCMTLSAMTLYAQTFDWAIGLGASGFDIGYGITSDGKGNIYVAGRFNGTMDFNPGTGVDTLRSAGGNDIFLAKYDAAGNYVWAKGMGGKGTDWARGVAVDASGNIYITGYFAETADFNPGPGIDTVRSAGGSDVFLAKYDQNGNYLWAKGIGGNKSDNAFGVAVDGKGGVYIAGYFNGTADFDPGAGIDTLVSLGLGDIFLAKYDSDGNYAWAKRLGNKSDDQSWGLAVDGSGYVYVIGTFGGTVDFDPVRGVDTLMSMGGSDIFIAKYDGDGKYVWAKNVGGKSSDQGYGITVDKPGNVYITGYFTRTADFNPAKRGVDTIASVGASSDGFVAKYDSSGNYKRARSIGGSDSDYGQGVAVDGSGNVYVTGYFRGSTDFNQGTGTGGSVLISVEGSSDAFIAKYDRNGNYIWAKGLGGKSSDIGYAVTVDGSGNVYFTGYFEETVNFDKPLGLDPLKSNGSFDLFLVKLGCTQTSASSVSASLECGDSYSFNDSVYTNQGIYTQIFPNAIGCDSTVTLDLTFIPMDEPGINVDGFTLGVIGNYASYQWLKDSIAIPGATAKTYEVSANGYYQVVVANDHGCSDTSDGYRVGNFVSLPHIPSTAANIYPNPAHDRIYIQYPEAIDAALTGMEGKVILKVNNAKSIDLNHLADGIYILRIEDKNGRLLKSEKITKQSR